MSTVKREFRPIDEWPWPLTVQRQRSRFDTPYDRTLTQLDRELEHLDTDVAILSLALTEDRIRNDRTGPYANATPDHPGVMVIAQGTRHGTLRYATDTFRYWHDNLRAIALGLEALRKVDRYGITQGGQQYSGFAALPAPSGSGPSHMTHDEAIELLAAYADEEQPRLVDPELLVKRARAAAHPDRHGGDMAHWDRVEAAAPVALP